MTTSEAAAYLELPVDTLRRLVRTGRLKALRTDGRVSTRTIAGRRQKFTITGRLHFRKEDLDAWRTAHETAPAEQVKERRIANVRQAHSAALGALMPRVRVFSTD